MTELDDFIKKQRKKELKEKIRKNNPVVEKNTATIFKILELEVLETGQPMAKIIQKKSLENIIPIILL